MILRKTARKMTMKKKRRRKKLKPVRRPRKILRLMLPVPNLQFPVKPKKMKKSRTTNP
jgi:hypothetical protein